MTARSLGWAGLLCALSSFATSSGCGGQATSLGQEPTKCEPNTKCAVGDAGEPWRLCGPGTVWNGVYCVAVGGTGGATSTGGRTSSGGATSTGGRTSSGGATSTDASPSSGGVSTWPDAGGADLDAETTAPVFDGCEVVYDVSYESFRVSWNPATDDSTASTKIVYEVWARPLGSTGDAGSVAPTTSVVGKTFADVEGLLPDTEYEVLCSAKDEFGNRDNGGRLLSAKTLIDGTPPTFAGIKAAAGKSRHAATLSWSPATDNATDGSRIVYLVYGSVVAGGQDFTLPMLTTEPGATTVTVPWLTQTTYYFVVRARDRAGNEEQNAIEAQVTLTLPTSFAIDVQPIFTQNCAILSCHTNGADHTNPPIHGLNLDPGAAYVGIVNVVAREGVQISPPEPNLKLIDGTSTNPMDSYLWRKIEKTVPANIWGNAEPQPQSQRTLTSEQIQIITDWITEGSLNN